MYFDKIEKSVKVINSLFENLCISPDVEKASSDCIITLTKLFYEKIKNDLFNFVTIKDKNGNDLIIKEYKGANSLEIFGRNMLLKYRIFVAKNDDELNSIKNEFNLCSTIIFSTNTIDITSIYCIYKNDFDFSSFYKSIQHELGHLFNAIKNNNDELLSKDDSFLYRKALKIINGQTYLSEISKVNDTIETLKKHLEKIKEKYYFLSSSEVNLSTIEDLEDEIDKKQDELTFLTNKYVLAYAFYCSVKTECIALLNGFDAYLKFYKDNLYADEENIKKDSDISIILNLFDKILNNKNDYIQPCEDIFGKFTNKVFDSIFRARKYIKRKKDKVFNRNFYKISQHTYYPDLPNILKEINNLLK